MGEDANQYREQTDQMKRDLDKTSLSISSNRFFQYFLYACVFYGVIYNQIPIQKMYSTNQALDQAILNKSQNEGREFDEIYNVTHVLEWVKYTLASNFKQNKRDIVNGKESEIRLSTFNTIITPVRFLQTRRKIEDNWSNRFSDFIEYMLSYDPEETILGFKKPEHTDEDSFAQYEMFQYFDGLQAGAEKGGFFVMGQIDEGPEELIDVAEEIVARHFIDGQSDRVIVDFVTYNGSSDVFSYVFCQFTITMSGLVIPYSYIQTIDIEPYKEKGDLIRMGFEIFLFVLTIQYAIVQILEFKAILNQTRFETDSNQNAAASCLYHFIEYFANFFNAITVASIAFSTAMFILWYSMYFDDFRVRFVDGDIDDGNEILDGFSVYSQKYSLYIRLIALNCLLISCRCIRYEQKFVRIFIILRSLTSAASQIKSFFVMCFGIILAFMLYSYVIFGPKLATQSTVGGSMLIAMRMFFWDLEIIEEMLANNPVAASIYFLFFTMLILIIIGNVIIALIGSEYHEQKDYFALYNAELKPTWEDHIGLKIKAYLKDLCVRLSGICKKENQIIYKHTKEQNQLLALEVEQETQAVESMRMRLVDQKFSREQALNAQNPELLTDKMIQAQDNEIKGVNGRMWAIALFFSLQVIIFITVVLMQCAIPQKYTLNKSIEDAILNPVWISDPDRNLMTVRSFDDFENWFLYAFPQIAHQREDGKLYVAGNNYILGQDQSEGYRLSFKIVEKIDNDNDNFKDYQKLIRERTTIREEKSQNIPSEVTKDMPANNKTIEYFENEGYNRKGAYILYPPVNTTDLFPWQMNIIDMFLSGLIDIEVIQMSSIVLDFCLYNGPLHMVTYVAIIFVFYSGGNVEVELLAEPITPNLYTTPTDLFRAFLEVCVVASFFYQISMSIKLMREQSEKYDEWRRQITQVLSPGEAAKRKRIMPEFVRKAFVLVDIYVLLDFLFYALCLALMFIWFAFMISLQLVLRNEESLLIPGTLEEDDTDFFMTYNVLASYMAMYYKIAALSVMLLVFRMLKYVALNKSMAFIQITMGYALADLLQFIIMFATLLVGFTFLAFIGFGRQAQKFSEPLLSFMALFEMILGSFDWDSTVAGDQFLGPLFIILFMMMFMYVYANIFIAILEIAYTTFNESKSEDDKALPDPFASIFIYCVKRCKKKKKVIEDDVVQPKKKKADILDDSVKSEIPFELKQEDAMYFGNQVAENILLMKKQRKNLKPDRHKKHLGAIPDEEEDLWADIKKFWEFIREQNLTAKDHYQQTTEALQIEVQKQVKLHRENKQKEAHFERIYKEIHKYEQQNIFCEREMAKTCKEIEHLKAQIESIKNTGNGQEELPKEN